MDGSSTTSATKYYRAACAIGALAVVLGAFGAHGLKSRLDADHLGYWHTAVQYHFYHAAPLFALALLARDRWTKWTARACAAWIAGIAIFSGSLYLLALTNQRWLGAITPFGGVAFILGWLFALGAVARR